ncbi:TetR family transcriptional regulator [Frigoribacterium sp. CFBP 13729]|uniref:TetR/AcrR family transcriptional regulator n=1 Tax=Frigoribacterium sp. CFBP 13729 TaxID=2775293 RepID=UPI0017860CF5|nr:TetR/AcrR family transcriptional regulator [Frigoribacterium sp. CFBP 13729]MBD8610299.1 TetR family transcriptional regulator [Frigoribacterium sp. CFBP 13729]
MSALDEPAAASHESVVEQPPAAPPGRYRKGVAKREAILEAALPVFGKVGFHGASLREIARSCGVSHQSLMHYFATKDELLMAVLRRRDERLRQHFDDEGGMRLAELVALAEYNVDVPAVISLFITASAEATSSDHPAHDYYADHYDRIIGSTSAYLAVAEAHGWLRDGFTAESAARVVLAVQDGLQLQWLYRRDEVQVADLMRLVIGTVVTVPTEQLDDAVRAQVAAAPS